MTQRDKSRKPGESTTKVNYPQSVFSGIRKTVGFKCDTGLYKEFKQVARAKMGSVCRPLECFMIAFLALNQKKVNFGETVRIENLNVLRDLRPRRKLPVDTCGFKGCSEPAVVVGVWLQRKEEYHLCQRHLLEAEGKPREWKVISRSG